MAEFINKTIYHYKILEQIGQGGMGEVYKAQDTRLLRYVALKLLPTNLMSDTRKRSRFIREAQTASSLNHPNICTIYEIDEFEGKHFIAMELIDGETLRERLERQGPFKESELINITIKICDALTAVHKKGIFHRDIKPENIMISREGYVKILDFGISKLATESAKKMADWTASGYFDRDSKALSKKYVNDVVTTNLSTLLGTIHYMSPEQAQGKPVDQRTDIFSLGIVLYELLTGQKPFDGDTNLIILSKIINEEPEPVSKFKKDISIEFEEIVNKALQKKKEKRFQHIDEITKCLTNKEQVPPSPVFEKKKNKITDGLKKRKFLYPAIGIILIFALAITIFLLPEKKITPSAKKTILVSTFENQTEDPAHDPIGLMAADWVKQGLLETGLVTIISIPETDLSAKARKNIDMKISGAYYQAGETIQFHAQITDFQNGEILIAIDPMNGSVIDPVPVISALRQKLLGALASRFDSWLKYFVDIGSRPPTYEAYQEYIKAYDYEFEHRKANIHYYKAAALDSTFSQALLQAAFRHICLYEFGKADSIVKIVGPSQRRLPAIDRYWLEFLEASLTGNKLGIHRAFQKMAELNADFQIYCAANALNCNRPREALDLFSVLDPEGEMATGGLRYYYWSRVTRAYHVLGDHEQELKVARHGRQLFPNSVHQLYNETRALAALGRIEVLNERLSERLNMGVVGTFTPANFMLRISRELYRHGYKKAAKEVIEQAIRWYKNNPSNINDYQYAQTLFMADRLEESQELLEKLVLQWPENILYQGLLALVYAAKGDREKAMQISQLLETQEQPYLFGNCTFWRAEIAAVLGEKERAMVLLRQALNQGLDYWRLHQFRALESLWDYPPFIELIKPKG